MNSSRNINKETKERFDLLLKNTLLKRKGYRDSIVNKPTFNKEFSLKKESENQLPEALSDNKAAETNEDSDGSGGTFTFKSDGTYDLNDNLKSSSSSNTNQTFTKSDRTRKTFSIKNTNSSEAGISRNQPFTSEQNQHQSKHREHTIQIKPRTKTIQKVQSTQSAEESQTSKSINSTKVIEINNNAEPVMVEKKIERKKWNKSTDQGYFIPSTGLPSKQINYDEITYESNISSPSSRGDSNRNVIVKPFTKITSPNKVGDILVHQSPTNSSITSIDVLDEQKSTPKSNRSDDIALDLTHLDDDDDDDVCISFPTEDIGNPKIVSQKSDFSKYSESTETVEDTVIQIRPEYSTELEKMGEATDEEGGVTESSHEEEEMETTKKVQKRSIKSDGSIVAVVIHKMDNFVMDTRAAHPLVKIHFIDMLTGEYLKKSDPKRSVCFCYENEDIDYISPVLTHEYDFAKKKSLTPRWEETIILNEDYEYLANNENVIIFFEILDFASLSVNSLIRKPGSRTGWHKIAWAFLKLVPREGIRNTETQLRLQLYKTETGSKLTANSITKCDAYKYWLKKQYKKYPATLYVTVQKLFPNYNTSKVLRSQNPIQKEYETRSVNSITIENEIVKKEDDVKLDELSKLDFKIQWNRTGSQSCKVPNKLKYKLYSGGKGCFNVKFSNNGFLLACGIANFDTFDIVLYQVTTGEKYCKLSGHKGLIYALDWSEDDAYLLSGSADCVIYIWDIKNKLKFPAHMLPHPSFVYAALFQSGIATGQLVVVSGCYDHVIRIWRQTKKNISHTFELFDELEQHNGYITSFCFNKNRETLFSSDSEGTILAWALDDLSYTLKRSYKIRELKEQIINSIQCHPGGQRLLVQVRDGILRMIDIGTGSVMQWFRGLAISVQTWCCLSPCGSLVFASSPTGAIQVWNTDTGHHAATYKLSKILVNEFVIHCIDFHPKDHIIALSHYGHYNPVLMFEFDGNFDDGVVEKFSQNVVKSADSVKVVQPSHTREVLVENRFKKIVRDRCDKPTFENIIAKMDLLIQNKDDS